MTYVLNRMVSVARPALIAALLLLAFTASAAPGGTTGDIRIAAIEGKVEVLPPGSSSWVSTTAEQILQDGWRLRTGPESRVRLVWSDESVISFGAHTEIEILPEEEEKASFGLSLMRGLLSFFHRDEPGRIRIRTQGANASVEGTEFVMEVGQGVDAAITRLSVIDGLVRFGNETESIAVTNMQQAVAEAGSKPRYTAGFVTNNVLQWALYYPAVLDVNDLPSSTAQDPALEQSIRAYASGDLLAALEAYPAGRLPESDSERDYHAALLLSVGQVSEAALILNTIQDSSVPDRARRLAIALRTMIAAVKLEARPAGPVPELPTEFLAASYYEQSRATGDESLAAALAMARRAADGSPEFGFAFARVAELELCFGRVTKAKEALRWARSFTPRNAQALAMEGFVLASENRTHRAIASFDQALQTDPGLGNAWLGRGLSRIRRGDLKGGREDLLIAAAIEPQRALLRSYLAKAYEATGAREQAAHEIRRAQALDPQDPTSWLYSALINQQNNRINPAIRDLERSQDLNDNRALFRSELLLDQDRALRSANLASVYRDAGMGEVAVREAARAVTYDYANSSAHLFISDSFNELRDPTQFNLRYETVWFSELLLANLLAPVGAARLSQTLGQFDNVRLFESDHAGLASSTYYRSDGQVREQASQFGTLGNTAWAIDVDYQHNDGVRANNELDRLGVSASIKQQITPADSVLLMANYLDFDSGDNFQYYDPTQASPGYGFEEQQQPLLAAGYHHEWSPGVHTLLLGGWLDSKATFSDQNFPQLYITPPSVIPPGPPKPDTNLFDVDYETDLQVHSVELNQIVRQEAFTLIVGGLWQGGDLDGSDVWSPEQTDNWFTGPLASGEVTESYERLQAYGYLTVEPIDALWLTAGLSYDYVEYPSVFLNPPVASGSTTRDLLAPKAALVWAPLKQLAVRGMYSQSLGGYSLDQSVRLEPQQLAGFPQAFRTVISESLVGSVAAPWQEVVGVALDLKFETGTYAGLQFNHISSDVDRTMGIFRIQSGAAIASTTTQSLDYEESAFTVTLNQIIGSGFSLGANYRFTDANLTTQWPELSALNPAIDEDFQSFLHRVGGYVLYNHPCGFFARFDAAYYQQSNQGDVSGLSGDSFTQLDLLFGYRFARRHAALTFGILNLTDTDYQLYPLTYYSELPRERVFVIGLEFQL